MQHVFNVQGMGCIHCVKAITQAIAALDPQAQVRVDLDGQKVTVQSPLPHEVLTQTIAAQGYEVQP